MNDNKLTYRDLAQKYLTDEQRAYYEGNVEYWRLDLQCELANEKNFLAVSFDWKGSKEGFEYWSEINCNLNK